MDTRQIQESRQIQASDQDNTNQRGKKMYSSIIRSLAVVALLGLAAGTGHRAQAAPASVSAEIPDVVNCSLFGEFYDETGRQLRETNGLSWEAQLCAGAEGTSEQPSGRRHSEPDGNEQAVGLNCTMVARFYDERGTVLPGLQLLPWETFPCAAMQSSKYPASLGR